MATGTFNLNDLSPTGSLLGLGGFPYGRHFQLARDANGNIVDKAFTRETYTYFDFESDFADIELFNTVIDGEQMSMTLSDVNFQHNVTFGNVSVPEPSGVGVIVSLALGLVFRRRRF